MPENIPEDTSEIKKTHERRIQKHGLGYISSMNIFFWPVFVTVDNGAISIVSSIILKNKRCSKLWENGLKTQTKDPAFQPN